MSISEREYLKQAKTVKDSASRTKSKIFFAFLRRSLSKSPTRGLKIGCKSTFTVSGTAVIAIKATADGGKGINSTGLVTVSGGNITVVTLGNKFTSAGSTSRARGVTADGGLTLTSGTLRVRSADDAFYTPATLSVSGGNLQAFTSSAGNSLRYATLAHTAGWLAYN